MSGWQVIAERKLLVEAGGAKRRREIVLQVGLPYWIRDGIEAVCPVKSTWVGDETIEIQGIDPFQALQLALAFLETVSASDETFRSFWPDGEPYESTGPRGPHDTPS